MAGGSPDNGPVMEGVASAVGAAGAAGVVGEAGASVAVAGLAGAGVALCALQIEANPRQNAMATTLPT